MNNMKNNDIILSNYKNFEFNCTSFGWRGLGDELSFGEFSEQHYIQDFDCPKCFEHLCFIQASLIENIQNEKRRVRFKKGQQNGSKIKIPRRKKKAIK